MSTLADQLKNVTLKKSTEPMKDFSSPKTAGFMNDGDIAGIYIYSLFMIGKQILVGPRQVDLFIMELQ